jgi:glycine oxidase
VLERDAPGAAASSVAAGMLAPVTEAEFGEEHVLRLNLAGAERWPAFAAELAERSGRDAGLRESGALVVAADRDDAEELRRLHAFQESLGLDAAWRAPRALRRLEPGLAPGVAGGIEAPQDHSADPRLALDALRAALAEAGGELRPGATVAGVETEGGRVTGVTTTDGSTVSAGAVVLAAGPWSGELEGAGATPPVRPVKGQILRLRGPRPCERLIRTPRCYLVPRDDDRLVVGATVEERGFDTTVTGDGVFRLLEAAREVVPDVGELELEEARAGLRPATPDNAPVVGPGEPEGVVWATGHWRNGILLAPITADAVTALVLGEEPPVDLAPFALERFALAGGRR